MEKFPDNCKNCIKRNFTCCYGPESMVPLTIKDIERIESLGFKKEDFVSLSEFSKEDDWGASWWVDSFIRKDGKIFRITTKKKDGGCYFLEHGKGCKIEKSRPFFCRLYPFWVEEDGKIVFEPGEEEYCLLYNKETKINELLEKIGETEEDIKRYCKEIQEDCINNKMKHEKLFNELLNKKS